MQNKTLVVIQCRYNSSRLCGKALYPFAGVPMLVFLLRRLKSALPGEKFHLVLATSDSDLDSAVASWGEREEVSVVRGNEDDVLSRYMQCLSECDTDTIVRVTADNPLTCPEVLMQMVQEHRHSALDYLQPGGLPVGVGVDVFSAAVLRILDAQADDGPEREHINLRILENPDSFRAATTVFSGDIARPDLCMTVDTLEEWQCLSSLFTGEDEEPWKIGLGEAIARMDHSTVCG